MQNKPSFLDQELENLSKKDIKRLICEACYNQLKVNREKDISDFDEVSQVMFAMFWNDPEEAFKYMLENAKD